MKQKTIAFVPRRSRIRLYKIAKAAKLTGKFRLVLICEEWYYDNNLFDGLFDEVHFFTSKNFFTSSKLYSTLSKKYVWTIGLDRLVKLIRQIKPDLIHTFCEPYDHIQKLIKETDIPVVMTDGADFSGISSNIDQLDPKTREQEKFAFEQVKGLVYKGPRHVTEYYRSFGYSINCKEITWVDHTDEDLFVSNVSKLSDDDQEIHFVYTGNVSVKPEMKYCYYVPLAEILAQQKIHLHLYPNPYQYKTSPAYTELDKNEKYFHFHKPLPMKDLIQEIAKYDWGLWVHAEDPSSRTRPDKMKTGMVNKLFTYLEAGLPVIVSDSRIYGAEYVEKYGLGFKVNDKEWVNFAKRIEEIDFVKLKQHILSVRSELSIQRNCDRLADFYLKLIA